MSLKCTCTSRHTYLAHLRRAQRRLATRASPSATCCAPPLSAPEVAAPLSQSTGWTTALLTAFKYNGLFAVCTQPLNPCNPTPYTAEALPSRVAQQGCRCPARAFHQHPQPGNGGRVRNLQHQGRQGADPFSPPPWIFPLPHTRSTSAADPVQF